MNQLGILNLLAVLAPIVTELQKDLADGKISFDEGVSLAELLAENVQRYIPAAAVEATLIITVCNAITDYQKAKAAGKPPVVKVNV